MKVVGLGEGHPRRLRRNLHTINERTVEEAAQRRGDRYYSLGDADMAGMGCCFMGVEDGEIGDHDYLDLQGIVYVAEAPGWSP
jgi:hypothetical protein